MKRFFKYIVNVLLCILCSLPVITLMDSVTAMHFVNFKLRDNADINVFQEFFKSLKTNFTQSLVLTVLFGGLGTLLAVRWISVLGDLSNVNKTEASILAIASFLYFVFESFSSYILAKFENPFGRFVVVVIYAISGGLDAAIKMAVFEMGMVALAAIIVMVNPDVIIFCVAVIVLFLVLVCYEMLSASWIIPIYEMLLTPIPKPDENTEEISDSDEISNEEVNSENEKE